MSRLGDRLLGVVLLALAAGYAVSAAGLEVPFAYDPLGPRAFPYGLAALLAILAVVLLVRPTPGERWPTGMLLFKIIGVLVLLTLYAALLQPLGYLLSSLLAIGMLAWLFGARLVQALLCAVGLTLGSYALFVYALDISLPAGRWLAGL